jgi:hypothetical protein
LYRLTVVRMSSRQRTEVESGVALADIVAGVLGVDHAVHNHRRQLIRGATHSVDGR